MSSSGSFGGENLESYWSVERKYDKDMNGKKECLYLLSLSAKKILIIIIRIIRINE